MLLGVVPSPVSTQNENVFELVDFFEAPGWTSWADLPDSLPETMVLHNLDPDWSLAARSAIDAGWATRLQLALQRTKSPWFSVHLGFACERVTFDGHMHPVSEPLDREVLIERIVGNLLTARDRCPVPLLVENLDYCPEGAYEHVCEPKFIRKVLERSGCDLLLDLGHLQVSASWLGIDPDEYLATLPLERVVEIHMSSPRPHPSHPGRLDDVHACLTALDYDLLHWTLERSDPRAVTLEYRDDDVSLVEQLNRLRSLLE